MNRYGRWAWEAWRVLAPTALSEIPDPSRHFSQLGELAAAQVADLTRQLAGPDEPGEPYLEKVGRLNAAQSQAEEIVRSDLLTPPTEEIEDLDEGDLMGPYELLLQQLQDLTDEYRRHRQ